MTGNRQFGKAGETLALHYLQLRGYRILERNYRNRLGEIDIIAEDKGAIVFIEVKARRSGDYGDPKWAVTPKKRRTLSMVALSYLKEAGKTNANARFDVVAIRKSAGLPEVEIVRNAFELAYP